MGNKYIDPIIPEMILKNANNRIVDLKDEFDSDSIYKLKYWLERVVKQDDKLDIPMNKRDPITIRISSYGGECYELWDIISTVESLQNRGYIINTMSCGKSMSCGFMLFLVGDDRIIQKYSTLMYHSVSNMYYGKVQEIKENLEETNRLNEMAKAYVLKKTKVTIDKLNEVDKCKQDWFINSEEALSLGIATKII